MNNLQWFRNWSHVTKLNRITPSQSFKNHLNNNFSSCYRPFNLRMIICIFSRHLSVIKLRIYRSIGIFLLYTKQVCQRDYLSCPKRFHAQVVQYSTKSYFEKGTEYIYLFLANCRVVVQVLNPFILQFQKIICRGGFRVID